MPKDKIDRMKINTKGSLRQQLQDSLTKFDFGHDANATEYFGRGMEEAEQVFKEWLEQQLDPIALGEYDGFSLTDFIKELLKECIPDEYKCCPDCPYRFEEIACDNCDLSALAQGLSFTDFVKWRKTK